MEQIPETERERAKGEEVGEREKVREGQRELL
jgi:hypothetical protein